MKINNIKLAIAMLAFSATSCTDALDRLPLDEISDATFWNTESDLLTYNNGLYAYQGLEIGIMLGHNYNDAATIGTYLMLDAFSDNFASKSSTFATTKSGLGVAPASATTSDQPFGYLGWGFLYEVNYGLANYDRADVEQSVKDKYIGEASLMRGWFYAVKVQRFGDVQWVGEPLNIDSEELYGERDSRDFVMEKVLEDLDVAIAGLPEDWGDGGAPGRMNKYVALAVKARVCLFEGTFRKYHGLADADMWIEEARDAAKAVIDSGNYSLYVTSDPIANEDYAEICKSEDLSDSPQIIYWRRYSTGVQNTRHNAVRGFCSNHGGATRSMVESYLCTDGLPICESTLYQGDHVIEDTFENRDPRMRQSLLHPEDTEARNFYYSYSPDTAYPRLTGMSGNAKAWTGYHVIKPFRQSNSSISISYRYGIEAGVIAQYAEVLLNYVEAVAELGEITQSDLDITINTLRDRVNMPHLVLGSEPVDPQAAEDGVSPLIYEIRRERRVELFAEGFRYDDLMRWKQGAKLAEKAYGMQWNDDQMARYSSSDVLTSVAYIVDPENGNTYVDPMQGTSWETPKFDEDKDYLWPIPRSIISTNPNITQNPGW